MEYYIELKLDVDCKVDPGEAKDLTGLRGGAPYPGSPPHVEINGVVVVAGKKKTVKIVETEEDE